MLIWRWNISNHRLNFLLDVLYNYLLFLPRFYHYLFHHTNKYNFAFSFSPYLASKVVFFYIAWTFLLFVLHFFLFVRKNIHTHCWHVFAAQVQIFNTLTSVIKDFLLDRMKSTSLMVLHQGCSHPSPIMRFL